MKNLVTTVLVACLLQGCSRSDGRQTPPWAFRNWRDKLTSAVGLGSPGCERWVNDNSGGYYEGIPEDQCVMFDGQRRWRGIWRDDFEGSVFCPAPAKDCGYETVNGRSRPLIWLDVDRVTKKPPDGALYSVDFIGHRSTFPGSYGHMGMFDADIIVDRFLSMKQIEAAPKRDGTEE